MAYLAASGCKPALARHRQRRVAIRVAAFLVAAFLGMTQLLMVSAAWGQIPAMAGRIVDQASILSTEDATQIAKLLEAYERETTHQIAVLTVRSLEGEAIESFSLRIARAWQLGRRGDDNGIVLVVAPKERSVRIELGAGFETFISNERASEIISKDMVPSFKRGAWSEGIGRGVAQLMRDARAYSVQKR